MSGESREQLRHCFTEESRQSTFLVPEFLFLYESDPIIVLFNVFEQFFCETVSSFFNQRGH